MPHTHPRRILLAVTGMSPQIVTETLYALAVQPDEAEQPFVPTEIHLLTTSSGAQQARTALLHPDGGQFHALLVDYPQLGTPRFDESCIHVIHDAKNQPLADIRTPEENAHAADSITALVAEFTRDPKSALHASIAGGRKTMGFYLGYAFSLFARPQDQLSHVLVSNPFEGHPEFFFKPAIPRRLTTRDNRNIDTADATITLARIPVVSLRHGQPTQLLEGRASFNDTVSAIRKSLAPPQLHIDLGKNKVKCGDATVQLSPSLLAWFAWWAQLAQKQQGSQNWRSADARQFLALYRCIVGPHSDAFDRAEERLKDGMTKEFFEENNSKLKSRLKDQLGPVATPYLLVATGKRPNTRYALALEPRVIDLRI